MTGSEYYSAIERQLQQSRKLIVVCSPRARGSDFVNDEIRRFIELRSIDDVIPVLAHGIPNNEASDEDADQQAFPDVLVEAKEMPLAISFTEFEPKKNKINKNDLENSWFALLATFLGKSRSEIEQREYWRRARRRNISLAVVSSVAFVLAGVALIAWMQKLEADYQREIALGVFEKDLFVVHRWSRP